jgi:hypothetical protein
MNIGDTVSIKQSAPVVNRELLGKAGYISNKLDNDFLVTLSSGQSILIKRNHLELIK